MEAPSTHLLTALTPAALGDIERAFVAGGHVVHTGISELDELLGPLPSGSLTVIAAGRGGGDRRSHSNSRSRRGHGVLVDRAAASEIALRVLAMEAGVNGGAVRHGRVSERMWRAIGAAVDRIDKLPSVFVESGVADASRLRAWLDCPGVKHARTIVLDGIDVGGTSASNRARPRCALSARPRRRIRRRGW